MANAYGLPSYAAAGPAAVAGQAVGQVAGGVLSSPVGLGLVVLALVLLLKKA